MFAGFHASALNTLTWFLLLPVKFVLFPVC